MRFLIIALLLTGCKTAAKFGETMDTLKGQTGDSLIDRWGVPRDTIEKRSGGRTMEYRVDNGCIVHVSTDKNDIIQSWTSEGLCLN